MAASLQPSVSYWCGNLASRIVCSGKHQGRGLPGVSAAVFEKSVSLTRETCRHHDAFQGSAPDEGIRFSGTESGQGSL